MVTLYEFLNVFFALGVNQQLELLSNEVVHLFGSELLFLIPLLIDLFFLVTDVFEDAKINVHGIVLTVIVRLVDRVFVFSLGPVHLFQLNATRFGGTLVFLRC